MDYVRRHAMMIAIVAIAVFTLCFTGVFASRWFFSASDGAYTLPERTPIGQDELMQIPLV
jgi:hypothetical protein